MQPTDETYLLQFRALAASQRQVAGMIAGLRQICESLQDWRKTAGQLSVLAADSLHPLPRRKHSPRGRSRILLLPPLAG